MSRDNFFKKVWYEPNTGCWLFVGASSFQGYGKLKKENYEGFVFAHRYSYFIHNGPFDKKMLVCHHCDTPECVNPDHLYLGTVQQNNKDRDRRGRRNAIGDKNGRTKLTTNEVLLIRSEYKRFEVTQKHLADKYSISVTVIQQILRLKIWNHI